MSRPSLAGGEPPPPPLGLGAASACLLSYSAQQLALRGGSFIGGCCEAVYWGGGEEMRPSPGPGQGGKRCDCQGRGGLAEQGEVSGSACLCVRTHRHSGTCAYTCTHVFGYTYNTCSHACIHWHGLSHTHTNIRLPPIPSVCCFDIHRPHAPQVGSLAQTRSQALHLPGYPRTRVAMTIMFLSWDSWDPDSLTSSCTPPPALSNWPLPGRGPGTGGGSKSLFVFL